MLSSAIIDPNVVGLLSATDAKFHESQLTHLLRGLHLNGLLLLDKHSILTKPLLTANAVRQNAKLSALLTTLIQDFSAKIPTTANLDPAAAIHAISERHPPDLVVTSAEPPYSAFGRGAERTQKLGDYHDCAAEAKRCAWVTGIGPIDSIEELSEILRRTLRHASWIRLYDAYFGSDTGQTKRRRSLQLILQNWFQVCSFPMQDRSMEIYCSDKETTASGLSRLKNELESMQRDFPIKFEIKVMRNVNSVLHARHIQTANFIMMADPGLDFFNSDETLRHVLLKPARGDRDHLRRVRSLQTNDTRIIPAPRR